MYWPSDPNKVPDLLDFFITKNISANYIKIEKAFDLTSDHSPITMTLSENIIIKDNNPTLTNKLMNWDHFRNELSDMIQLNVPLQTKQQLEYETEKFV